MLRSFLVAAATAAVAQADNTWESYPSCDWKPYCRVYAPLQTGSIATCKGFIDLPYVDPPVGRTIVQRLWYTDGVDPIPISPIRQWFELLNYQPNVMSLAGIGQGLTLFTPTDDAIRDLMFGDDPFPAFKAWLLGLPSCYAFNRLEYLLLLHATARTNTTCQDVTSSRYYIGTYPALAQQEYLTIWRNIAYNDAVYVGNSCKFAFNEAAQYTSDNEANFNSYEASNGFLHFIDKVIEPAVNPRALFPKKRLFDYLATHPSRDLTIFHLLLIHTGLDIDLIASVDNYFTVFVPVNEAFFGISLSKLFDRRIVSVVRQWVLNHFLYGMTDQPSQFGQGTYLYQGSLLRSIQSVGNVTLETKAQSYLTFTTKGFNGCVGSLQIRYNAFNTTCDPQANTIFPWVDIELRDAIAHKIDAFLMPPDYSISRRLGELVDGSAEMEAAALPALDVHFDDPMKQHMWDSMTEHHKVRRAVLESLYKQAGEITPHSLKELHLTSSPLDSNVAAEDIQMEAKITSNEM